MNLYLIEAVNREGKKERKIIEIDLEEELFRFLEFSGLIPIKIKKVPSFYRYLNIKKYLYRIKKQEIIEVLENLHIVVKSGIPVTNGLIDIAEDTDNPALKEMLSDMAYRLQIGYTLSRVFEHYQDTFSPVVVSLVKIGEETGSLDKTLKDASEHLKTRKYILLIGIFVLVLIFLVGLFRKRSERFRYETDKILLKLPVFGIIITNLENRLEDLTNSLITYQITITIRLITCPRT